MRFIGKFTGNIRKVNSDELKSIKRVVGLRGIDPQKIDKLVKREIQIEIGSTSYWMQIQDKLIEYLNTIKEKEILIYALFANEHEYGGQLHNNFLISEFATNFS